MIKFLEGWQNVAAIAGIAGVAVVLVIAVVCLVAVGVGNLVVKQFDGVEE